MGYKLYHDFQDERRISSMVNRTLIHIDKVFDAILCLELETKHILQLEIEATELHQCW